MRGREPARGVKEAEPLTENQRGGGEPCVRARKRVLGSVKCEYAQSTTTNAA